MTGATGQLGHDLAGALRGRGHEVATPARAELDVLDRDACAALVRRMRADVVVDCSEPFGGEQVDGLVAGAEGVACAAAEAGAMSVFVSCASVFAADPESAYVESDEPQPDTDFGRAKLAAEGAVARANPRHAIVRSSWLYGHHRESFVSHLLAEGRRSDSLVVDSDSRSAATYTRPLAHAMTDLVRQPAYGIHHACAAGSCTRLQFARVLFRLAGVDCRVVPALEGPGEGAGAAGAVLATRRDDLPPLADWRAGLEDYLNDGAGMATLQPLRRNGR